MPAIASVVNRAVPGDKSISLYFNTATAQLGYAFKSGTDGDDPETAVWAASISDYPGYILNPSILTSDYFRGVNLVVGITKPKIEQGATQTVNQVSLVSPVYKKLASTSLQNSSVTMCSSGTHAWVYYLDGPSKGQVRLKEYSFENGNVSTFLQNQDVELNCSLAAWYEPNTQERLVIYQEMEEGHLKEFNVVKKQSWDIDNTGDAKDQTTVAVSYADGKTYLYYTDSKDNLRRVIKDETGWGSPKTISGAPKVGTSQISVVAANGSNHIFYVTKDEISSWDDFYHVRDPLN